MILKITAHIMHTSSDLKLKIRCNGAIIGTLTTSNPITINRTSSGYDIDTLVADRANHMTSVLYVDDCFIDGEPVTTSHELITASEA